MLRRRGAKLTNTDLESVDFENADLSDAVLEGAQARFVLVAQSGLCLGEQGIYMPIACLVARVCKAGLPLCLARLC